MTKLEKFVLRWLNDNYNYMEPFLMEEYPDYIFHMKNGKCILQHNKKNGYVYVSYSEIWKFLESMFCMEDQQIKDLTKKWVEEHYKVGITTEKTHVFMYQELVEEHYKVGVTTTATGQDSFVFEVEEHYKVGVTTTEWCDLVTKWMVEEHYKEGITTISDEYSGKGRVEERYKEIQTTNNQLEFYSEKDVEELYEQNTNIN